MDLNLKGKRALVSGSTAGIGLSIAKALAKEGASVFITGRNKEKSENARQDILLSVPGADVTTIVADLGTKAGAETVINKVPSVDILVNNLGIYEAKSFFDIEDRDWEYLFEVNVMSGIRLSRHYMQDMLARNWGRVLFISSEASIMIPPEMIHYGLTKSAQLSVMRGLAELTKGTKVTVNAVLPGPTMSEGIMDFIKSVSSDVNASHEDIEREFFAKHRSSSLLQRMIDPAEIGNLVAFVASPLAAATNGASLRAEGGLLRSIY
jgi:NAD(P)-dependent dehydrogenase (short-subunit alcohol dehydrogenase family)